MIFILEFLYFASIRVVIANRVICNIRGLSRIVESAYILINKAI